MTKQKLYFIIKYYAVISAVFILTFTFLRIYEYYLIQHKVEHALSYEWIGFLYDWTFACSVVVIVFFFHLAFSFISIRAGIIVTSSLFFLMIIASLSLILYFSVPLTPLSTDLYGYSLQDIYITISSSGGLDWSAVASFLIYGSVFLGGIIRFCRLSIPERIPTMAAAIFMIIVCVIAVLPVKASRDVFVNDNTYAVVVNKSSYFIDRTYKHVVSGGVKKVAIKSFPFLHKINYNDILGQYFTPATNPPDIVFIIVEGLGSDFVRDGAYGGFTPFLDSLAGHSLYWKNTLSNAGRTFGALPSILGSLPYGKEGFMSYGSEMPDHQTLISLLKPVGYSTNFFYGGLSNFDNQDLFLEYQGIDYLLDETKFPASYKKMASNENLFSWGFSDRDMFSYSFERLNEERTSPRLNIFLTLSTHEPFQVPETKFNDVFDQKVSRITGNESGRNHYVDHRDVLSCLLYTDDVLRVFFRQYQQRPGYSNTIFVITGDHRLVPVPQDSRLSRFQVPLLIYSPMLNSAQQFNSIALHSDITPALLGYLHTNHGMQFPEQMPFISDNLPSQTGFGSAVDIALIRNKNEIIDYVEGEWFLSEDQLFKILPDLSLQLTDSAEIKKRLTDKLQNFKAKSVYACENNQLDKPANVNRLKRFKFTEQERSFLKDQKIKTLTPGQLFHKAKAIAFKNEYDKSRLLLRHLLNVSPNFHDARILMARTYGWEGNYDSARVYLDQAIQRSPNYIEAYIAFADVEYWAQRNDDALRFIEKGLKIKADDADLLARRARCLWLAGEKLLARQEIEKVLFSYPNHEVATDLLQKMNNENI